MPTKPSPAVTSAGFIGSPNCMGGPGIKIPLEMEIYLRNLNQNVA
ncbi:hypothetical protein [Flavobacterium columnare]|nr:hypothetical protein [Flavobacterium columnare]